MSGVRWPIVPAPLAAAMIGLVALPVGTPVRLDAFTFGSDNARPWAFYGAPRAAAADRHGGTGHGGDVSVVGQIGFVGLVIPSHAHCRRHRHRDLVPGPRWRALLFPGLCRCDFRGWIVPGQVACPPSGRTALVGRAVFALILIGKGRRHILRVTNGLRVRNRAIVNDVSLSLAEPGRKAWRIGPKTDRVNPQLLHMLAVSETSRRAVEHDGAPAGKDAPARGGYRATAGRLVEQTRRQPLTGITCAMHFELGRTPWLSALRGWDHSD